MHLTLDDTTSPEIARALVSARVDSGSPAMDMVLTFLVVTDSDTVGDALRTAATLSKEHPSRVIAIVLGDGRGTPRVDATVRVGENAAGESVRLRLYGPLVRHAESVVLPLLLPDSPVVVWWPGKPPASPAEDPIGRLAQRRLTDAEATDSPVRTLKNTARHYRPGDTDLSWTRLTPWRALLAAALDQSTGRVERGAVEAGAGNPVAKLLAAWLRDRLGVPITERRGQDDQISRVTLQTQAGEVSLERVDAESCLFSVPGASPRRVPMGARSVAELLAEDLRRLDPDEIYQETLEELLAP